MSESFRDVKLAALEKRKADLVEEYEAASRQLTRTWDETEKIRIGRHIKDLEAEIQDLERQIQQVRQPPDSGAETSELLSPSPSTIADEVKVAQASPVLDYETLLRLCAEHLDVQMRDLAAKYDPQLYVKRQALEEQFGRFLAQPDKNCFLVLGKSGSGKTNTLCYLAQECSARMPVMFLRGSMRVDRPDAILERLAEVVGLGIGQRIDTLAMLRSIHECVSANSTHLLVFIDGINETRDADALKEELRTTLQTCSGIRIRFCLSCRDQFWSYFDDDFWPHYVYCASEPELESDPGSGKGAKPEEKHSGDTQAEMGQPTAARSPRLGTDLTDYSETELDAAAEKYFAKYAVGADLVARARQRCRHPLLLRVFSEANQGQSPGTVDEVGHLHLIERYWDFKVKSIQKQLHQPTSRTAESVILAIAARMLAEGSSLLDEEDMQHVASEQGVSLDASVFVVLRDEGVLFQEESSPTAGEGQYGFYYDELLEYSLARLLFTQHNWRQAPRAGVLADFRRYEKRAREFFSVVGALEYSLLMLEQDRETDGLYLDLLAWLSRTSRVCQRMVAHCIPKLEHSTHQRCYSILTDLVQCPSARVREDAAHALGLLGRRDLQASTGVIQDIAFNGPVFGRDALPLACRELILMDKTAAMGILGTLSRDREPYVRRVVAWSLSDTVEIAPHESMELLGELGADRDWWVRRAAANSASDTMQFDLENSLGLLCGLCRDERAYVRRAAANSLAQAAFLFPDQLLALLSDWIRHGDPKLREAAGLALRHLTAEKPNEALDLVRALALDHDAEVREAAVYALGLAVQQNVDQAHELLQRLALDGDHEVRWAVASLLEDLDPDSAIVIIEALVQRPLRATWHEVLASTWKWIRECIRALLHVSAKDLVRSSDRVISGFFGLAQIEYGSVQARMVRSLQSLVSEGAGQQARILHAMAHHQNAEIRILAARALTATMSRYPNGQELLERLAADSSSRVAIAARKELLTIERRARLRRAALLDALIGGFLAIALLAMLYGLIPQHLLSGTLKTGLARPNIPAAVALSTLVTFVILGLLRFRDGFGRKQRIVGFLVGAGVATGLLLLNRSAWLAALGLLVVFSAFSLHYEYTLYFDRQAHNVLGYYVAFACMSALVALPVVVGLYSLLASGTLVVLVLGALSGLTVGMLRSIDENLFWRVSLEALAGLAAGVIVGSVIYLLEVSLYAGLPGLKAWLWTEAAHLILARSIMGGLIMGLCVCITLAIWGERYRGAVARFALLGMAMGCTVSIASGRGFLVPLSVAVGLAGGALFGLLRTSLKYRWHDTLRSVALQIFAGIVVGALISLIVGHSAAPFEYALAGAVTGYTVQVAAGLGEILFDFSLDEFSRLD